MAIKGTEDTISSQLIMGAIRTKEDIHMGRVKVLRAPWLRIVVLLVLLGYAVCAFVVCVGEE
jgi:hypothetical protein